MKIKVKRKHINGGIRMAAMCCPVALAIKEKLGIAVMVGNKDMHFDNSKDIRLSKQVQQFIKDFDVGDPVKPFEFEL